MIIVTLGLDWVRRGMNRHFQHSWIRRDGQSADKKTGEVPEAYAQQGTCAECFLDPETGCAMCRFQVEFGTENCCTPSCMVCDCNSVPCGPGLSDLGPRVLDATLLADLAVEIKNRHVSPDGAQGLTSFSVQTGAEGWSMRVIRSVLFGHGLLLGGDGAIYACDTTLVAHIVDLGTALDEGPRLPTLAARGLGLR